MFSSPFLSTCWGWQVCSAAACQPGHQQDAFNLNGFNANQSILDAQGKVILTWAEVINRSNLGMKVMHERSAHNIPVDLAKATLTPVALTAPAIGRSNQE